MKDRDKLSPFLHAVRSYDTMGDLIEKANSSYSQIISRQRHNQYLVAVGVAHSYELGAPSLSVVSKEFDAFVARTKGKKRVVLGEGGLRTPEPTLADSIEKDGEAGLIAFKAKKEGIRIESPEPPGLQDADELLQLGFTREQIIYYYIARQLPSIRKVGDIDRFFESLQTRLTDLEKRREPDNLLPKWSEVPVSYKTMAKTHDELFPDVPPGSVDIHFFVEQTNRIHLQDTVIRKITRVCNRIRDERLLREIIKHWQHGESVFLAYGAAHVYALEPALEMLGSRGQ